MTTPKVRVDEARCVFRGEHRGEQVRAVDGVSLEIAPGECLGLVGESGSGKSTLGRCIAGLQRLTSGTVEVSRGDDDRRARRPGRVQMVFQDPYDALNPRMRVADVVLEPLRLADPAASRASQEEVARQLLGRVHLGPEFLTRRPHELSGGQRQRVGVARALAADPELVIFDEPTSALDWMTRGELLELINEVRRARRLTCLFISHDLSAVARVSDRVAVMYLGRIVESGPRADVLDRPAHPYTQALLSAVLETDVREQPPRRVKLAGDPPSPVDPPSGCAFHPRCPQAVAACAARTQSLTPYEGEHAVACMRVAEGDADALGGRPAAGALHSAR